MGSAGVAGGAVVAGAVVAGGEVPLPLVASSVSAGFGGGGFVVVSPVVGGAPPVLPCGFRGHRRSSRLTLRLGGHRWRCGRLSGGRTAGFSAGLSFIFRPYFGLFILGIHGRTRRTGAPLGSGMPGTRQRPGIILIGLVTQTVVADHMPFIILQIRTPDERFIKAAGTLADVGLPIG